MLVRLRGGRGGHCCGEKSELVAAIQAIEVDASLTDKEKERKRQELLRGLEMKWLI